MSYVETYNRHHAVHGLAGSGSGKSTDKLKIVQDAGLCGSCLDYGCGWGMMAEHFKDYVGVDISDVAIEYACAENPGKEFYVIKNGELDLGRRFDFAICLSVFTHCLNEDVPRIFSDLSRHTDVAIIDIIHGEGGGWDLRKRQPTVFGKRTFRKIAENTSKFGVTHTYYLVDLEAK